MMSRQCGIHDKPGTPAGVKRYRCHLAHAVALTAPPNADNGSHAALCDYLFVQWRPRWPPPKHPIFCAVVTARPPRRCLTPPASPRLRRCAACSRVSLWLDDSSPMTTLPLLTCADEAGQLLIP